MSLDYHPDGMSMWDTWCVSDQGAAHMFHLQFYGENSSRPPSDADWIGHVISRDLLHWEEQPQALGPGPRGGLDDMQPWTGCVYKHNERFYFYYTMRSTREDAYSQRIGLALSDDLVTWTRHPRNPVILPDSRFYLSYEQPLPKNTVDCRDMCVIPDPKGSGWLGFYAARIPGGDQPATAAIAAARSDDLVTWEQLPPAFVPGSIAAIEVPDVYPIDGRWYLTCLTGNRYGNRGIFSDSSVRLGTIYAVSERAEGPYQMIEGDNLLLGGQIYSGYSCRSLEFEGERYVFYTQPVPRGPATVSPPMALRALPDGRLRLAYSERAKGWRKQKLITPAQPPAIARLPYTQFYWSMNAGTWTLENGVYHGEAASGWQTADLGAGAENIEFEANITLLRGAAAGLLFRPDAHAEHSGHDGSGDLVFYLDAQLQQAAAARLPAFDQQHVRSYPVETGRTYRVKLCIRQPRFEVYIDDILVLQSALDLAAIPHPGFGLFVDRGAADITDLTLYELG